MNIDIQSTTWGQFNLPDQVQLSEIANGITGIFTPRWHGVLKVWSETNFTLAFRPDPVADHISLVFKEVAL